VRNYIKNILIPKHVNVYLYTEDILDETYLDFYQQNDVVLLHKTLGNALIQKIPKLRGLVNILYGLYQVRRNKKYDAIHVHFADRYSCWFALRCHRMADKEICSFWGSDLFRSPDKELKKLKTYLNKCQAITITTKKMIDRFESVLGRSYANKIKRIRFGIEAFDVIDSIIQTEDRHTMRGKLGLPNDQIIICIGYNGSSNQQHLEILEQMAKIDPIICNKLFIVIQMTYGNDDPSYYGNVKSKLVSMLCDSKIFTEYMDVVDIARLRCVTDVFIHGQTTDALSASFQEYIYAGATVINAKWLKYSELDEIGIKYIEFSSFDEIPSLITDIVQNPESSKVPDSQNRKILKSFSSIHAVSEEWYSLY
jgi:hypothetical protein